MAKYGVEYEGFSSLVLKIENLGVSMNEVADKVLDEVAPLAVSTFKPHVPYDRKEKDSFHARNHVRASKTRDGYGGRYKLTVTVPSWIGTLHSIYFMLKTVQAKWWQDRL